MLRSKETSTEMPAKSVQTPTAFTIVEVPARPTPPDEFVNIYTGNAFQTLSTQTNATTESVKTTTLTVAAATTTTTVDMSAITFPEPTPKNSDDQGSLNSSVQPSPAISGKRSCYECGSESAPCSALELLIGEPTLCPPGLDYCATYVTQEGGTRAVIKSCIDLDTCFKKWFEETSDLTECTTFDPREFTAEVECKYCCVDDNCNKGIVPAPSSLYNTN